MPDPLSAETEQIGCRACAYRVPRYVRIRSGEQRSGWRMLAQHRGTAHRQRDSGGSAEDVCPLCNGVGCADCEPNGPVVYNGNTGEPIVND